MKDDPHQAENDEGRKHAGRLKLVTSVQNAPGQATNTPRPGCELRHDSPDYRQTSADLVALQQEGNR